MVKGIVVADLTPPPAYIGDFYVLRHIPTDCYFPETKGYYTAWDPKDGLSGYCPRLFGSRGAASRARSAWLAGVWRAKIGSEQDGWESPKYMVQDTPAPELLPEGYTPRLLEHVEIVRWSVEEHPNVPNP